MLIEIIREAWVALKRNLTRTFLTMLGIVWGIATVTLLIAYGNSFRQILVGGFDAFGKSVVICWPQQTCAGFVRSMARCATKFHPKAAG
jgi:putative ABC transport system permease protein